MPSPTRAHVQPAPAVPTEEEHAVARWEDEGGAVILPGTHEGHWLRIAAALSERLPELPGREDVLVTCRTATVSGAPASFCPDTAELEIDRALFAPLHPAGIRPARRGDEERYPVAWGALIHEAAHAAHSRWTTPTALRGTAREAAADVLEESRAERAHLGRRPADRRFLRAAVHALLLGDFSEETPTGRWQAASVAGLILARRDAGVLDPDETEPVQAFVTGVLGEELLEDLAAIWDAAHATGDEDETAMMQHAEAWCRALGAEAHEPEPPAEPGAPRGELAEAIGKVVAAVAANEAAREAAEARAGAARAARKKTKANGAARARQATETAEQVFGAGGLFLLPSEAPTGPASSSPVRGSRPPTGGEKAAAAQLARALRAAAFRERCATRVASALPPGRLNVRQAMARQAQKAAGVMPTATPWTRTVRRAQPAPPLRVGIAVDVSGSMTAAEEPIASAAWIIARAAALTDPDSRTATVAFDMTLTAITSPGRTPARVTRFAAEGLGHRLAEAIDALTAGLDLSRQGAGRLLVIVSDGWYADEEAERAARRIAALRAAGCAVLWLAFEEAALPLPGATFVQLAEPTQAAAEIGKAAARALTATQRA